VLRDEERLEEGLHRLELVRDHLDEVASGPDGTGLAALSHRLDLRAGLATAEATMRGALARRETRGCHNRSDHPQLDPSLRVNLHQRRGLDGSIDLWPQPVLDMPPELQRLIDQPPPLETSGRLLE
jgi:succinate dehydrogenase / fumarate reductase, flavoprotein subunit